MQTLTVNEIMEFHPCYDKAYITLLFEQAGYKNNPAPISAILNAPIPAKDVLWLVLRPKIIGTGNQHKIALFAAELVLPIFEACYPLDDRPRKVIEAKKKWLQGAISVEQLQDAANAAYDAYAAAANAAAANAAAAYAAAANAANAAANAAAADAAAANAAHDAAHDAAYAKILDYVKELIR